MWLVALDEMKLQDEGFLLGLGDVTLDVIYLRYEGLRLGGELIRAGKIRPHAAVQVDRLADVYNDTAGVMHDIDAGTFGHLLYFFFQFNHICHSDNIYRRHHKFTGNISTV